MPVRRRGKKWYVDVHVGNGKRVRHAVGAKKEAEAVERQIIADSVNGTLPAKPVRGVSFRQFIPVYLDFAKVNKAARTYECEVSKINRHLLPQFGHLDLAQIDARLIEGYKAKRTSDGVSPRTINIELTLLSVIFRTAIRWGHARQNPLSEVEKLKTSERPRRFLSADEVARLLASAKCTYLYPLVLTALHTGMRKSELFNLEWDDIDFTTNTITVQPKHGWNTKNRRYRVIEMTPRLREELVEEHDGSSAEQEYVFLYNGDRLCSNVTTTFHHIVRRAGLDDVTLHTLRHTFASHLAMQGVPLMHIQQLLGHKDYKTTLVYAHLSTESHKGQVQLLPFAK